MSMISVDITMENKAVSQSIENGDETQTFKEGKPRQPDTKWAWVVCAVGAASNIIVLGCAYCFGVIFPFLLDDFKEGKSDTAWMGSFAMASSGLFGPIAGRLTDRFGARAVVVCGSLMSATGLLLTSLVPNLYLMLLTYGGIFGFGSSLIYISIFEIVPRCFIKHRSLATGLITMSTGASLVVMSPVCQALIDAYGWRGAFRGMSGCTLVIFVMGWTLDPNVACEEAGESVEETKPSKTKETSKILDLSMWRNITFVVLAISSFFVFIGHTIPIVHLARYSEELGVDTDLVAWLYSCIGITSLLTRILGSKLCDVIGSQSVVLAFGMCGAMVTSVLLPLAINWTWLLFFSISYGLVDGLITIGVNLSCLQVLTQKQRAQGFGFYQLCLTSAILFGAPIGGLVADKTRSYPIAFLFASGIEAVGVFILLIFICARRVKFSRSKILIG